MWMNSPPRNAARWRGGNIVAMRFRLVIALVVSALLAALALALPARSQHAGIGHESSAHESACHGPIGADATFHTEMARANACMHEAMNVAPTDDPDRDFARMMIPHHQGAIDMALVLLKYGHDKRLKRLAQSIIVEQGQEIAYMRTLLDASRAQSSASPAVSNK
jgi:uncharacterized protein (DUF305 family)